MFLALALYFPQRAFYLLPFGVFELPLRLALSGRLETHKNAIKNLKKPS
jgi:hypothetical protein